MDFATAVNLLLQHEGGLVDDPNDPGGLTNWGWALHENPDLTADQIRTMTRDQAIARYKTRFWDRVQGDTLPAAIAFQLFDFAVNAGVGTAIRKAQEIAGVADDGNWGPITAAAVGRLDPTQFVARFAAAKIRFYTKLSNWADSGKGWMLRIADDIEKGLQ